MVVVKVEVVSGGGGCGIKGVICRLNFELDGDSLDLVSVADACA